MISVMDWKEAQNSDVEAFWPEVNNYRDAAGEPVFRELAIFALSMLSLPLSKAAVERTFSQMDIIKCKTRNKIQQHMLEAIIHVRAYMSRNNRCCNEFVPSQSMFARFNDRMYHNMDQNAVPEGF